MIHKTTHQICLNILKILEHSQWIVITFFFYFLIIPIFSSQFKKWISLISIWQPNKAGPHRLTSRKLLIKEPFGLKFKARVFFLINRKKCFQNNESMIQTEYCRCLIIDYGWALTHMWLASARSRREKTTACFSLLLCHIRVTRKS